jgi:hypothetical protein
MTLVLELFIALSLFELVLVNRWTWRFHRPLAAGLAITLAGVSGLALGHRPSLAMLLFAVLSLYRVVNLMRLVQGRSQETHLIRSARRITLALFIVQLALLTGLAIADRTHPGSENWWQLFGLLQLTVAAVLFLTTLRQLRKTAPLQVSEHFSDSHVPSLSVCIPARNETSALEDCLRSLIASDYPKLEIIVLDDCSQGGRTSDIIRGFAHDGVRFIRGDIPPKDWLAKNWAYQQLFDAASGELVLFCGVDVRFSAPALRDIVTMLLAKQKRMLSLIPSNELPSGRSNLLSLLIQPARYAWELCLPRRRLNRPPVLSSCWVAEHKLIDRSGSFSAVRTMVAPEAYFARKATHRDGYSFVQSVPGEIVSSKQRPEQWATAVRTRYPQLHRRLDMVFFVSLLELSLFVGSPILMIISTLQGHWLTGLLAGAATMLLGVSYGRVVALTYRRTLPVGFVLAPFAALLDIYIRHESAWRYEFGEVQWKGRNVCLPVMRVIPRLPKA